MKKNNIFIPVSIGEVFDKYTILGIKMIKIKDPEKLKAIRSQLEYTKVYADKFPINSIILNKLKSINLKLWHIKDKMRFKESSNKFDDEYIKLARSMFFINNNRAEIKKAINNKFNSDTIDIKNFVSLKDISQDEISRYLNLVSTKIKQNDILGGLNIYNNLLLKVECSNLENKNLINSNIYNYLADIYYSLNKLQDAVPYYERSISLYPDITNKAYFNVAYILKSLKNYARAEIYLKKVISINPKAIREVTTLGFMYLAQKKLEQGFKYLYQADIISPDKSNLKLWGGQKDCQKLLIYSTKKGSHILLLSKYILELFLFV